MKPLAAREISLEGQPGAFAGSLMNSSVDLVMRACQGDQEAFRLIFERYSRPVISFIYDQIGDRDQAEELTQETFVRAYRSLKSLREETKLSTWLFGIAKNVARESLRARIRHNRHVDLDDKQVLDLSDQGPVPVSNLLNKELNAKECDAIADTIIFTVGYKKNILKNLHRKCTVIFASI